MKRARILMVVQCILSLFVITFSSSTLKPLCDHYINILIEYFKPTNTSQLHRDNLKKNKTWKIK